MKIKFTNTLQIPLDQPQPAIKMIPDWYRKTESYIGGLKIPQEDSKTSATIKKCMPVFDALTSGYIITSPADVFVSLKDGLQWFQWSDFDLIAFHPIDQAPHHPLKKPHSYAKWNNPWAISTPRGYSCLFVQPFHRESVFTILPGVVDCDTYSNPVNFPFVINDPKFEGMIPKGTPIAQIIPFKRESWFSEMGTQRDLNRANEIRRMLKSKFFDSYKTMFWNKKEFK